MEYIHSTEDYGIRLGTAEWELNEKGEVIREIPGYEVVNLVTGIRETETRILPQAMEYVSQLQAALDAAREDAKGPTNVAELRSKFQH